MAANEKTFGIRRDYVDDDGKRRKLGSSISEAAGKAGGNLRSPMSARLPIAKSAQ
jgi:hypothetical protein